MERTRTSLYASLTRNTAAATLAVAAIASNTASAQNPPAPIPAFSICSQNVNVLSLLPGLPGAAPNPTEDGDTQFLNALISTTEAALLQDVATAPSLDL